MLERLDNIIYMLLNDLKDGNPVIKLAQRDDTFEGETRTNIYFYVELRRDYKLKLSYLSELEEMFGSDVSFVQSVSSGCNIIKTKISLESIKHFEEEE
ncbi:hypothetical protein [Methanobacterium sp. ACI-7]|uniref:hypothetical protein n=1 Tax=unclassified Methanobacterium TaxID=2627676 RepID=UPI0039C3762C